MNTYSKIRTYIEHNPIATLSTVDAAGQPHGAAVYVCADDSDPVIYFITKQATTKYQDLRAHDLVGITIVNPKQNSTLQACGRTFVVEDAKAIDKIMNQITRHHAAAKDWLPPIAKLRAGAYAIVGVTLTQARLADFYDKAIGDERIFTYL